MAVRGRKLLQRRSAVGLIGGALALVALGGCGGASGGGGSTATESSTSASGTPAAWQQGGGSAWKEALAAGRREGEVVVDSSPELIQSDFAADFQRDTGIKLTLAAGETALQSQSMDQQAAANKLQIDVSLGGGSEVATMLPQGELRPIKPQLLLPGVANPDEWRDDKLDWIDKQHKYVLQPTAYIFGWPIINTDAVKSFASWNDVLDPKYKGKIIAYDPLSFGVGLSYAALLEKTLGRAFVQRLYGGDQDVTYTRNRRQLVESVARGTYDIGIGATQADVVPFSKQGLPVTGILPPGPVAAVVGGSSVIKQPQNKDGSPGPHPNAATVFINWYLSKPGQEAYTRTVIDISQRKDVPPPPDAPKYIVPEPGRHYIDAYAYDWWTKIYLQTLKEITAIRKVA